MSWRELAGQDGDIPAASMDLEAMERAGRLSDLDQLGPGAAYCLARILEEESLDRALVLYRHEAENGNPLWRREALYRMVYLLARQDDHEGVVVWGWKSRFEFPEEQRVLPYLIRSSFLMGQYKEIPALFSALKNPDASSQLFHLVGRAAADTDKGLSWLEEAVCGIPLNEGYREVYPVLEREGLLKKLSPLLVDYLNGRLLMLDRQYGPASVLMEPALNDPRLAEARPRLYEDYRVYRSGLPGRGDAAAWLAEAAGRLKNPDCRWTAALGAVKLYRAEGKSAEAEAAARTALTAVPVAGEKRDEAQWYLFRTILDEDTGRFAEEFLTADFYDAGYYDDLFEAGTVRIVQDKRWEYLPFLWNKAVSSGTVMARNQVAWVSLLALHYHYLPAGSLSESALQTQLMEHDRWGYRGLLAGFLSRKGGQTVWTPLTAWKAPRRNTEMSPVGNPEMEEFFQALIHFGLTREVYEEAMTRYREIPAKVLISCGNHLSENGMYYETIRVVSRIFYEEWHRPGNQEIRLMFPRWYGKQVDAAADEFSLDPGLVFAVIRTESAFKADIVSHAGAMGLMQLMSATAAERARDLRLEHPDLTDPAVNIRLGSSHLRWLFERDWTVCPMDVLIAYNAGGGNLRKWKRRYEGLPPLLLAEALPPAETRNYVRKNLVALVLYDYLYYHKSPEVVIGHFFGE